MIPAAFDYRRATSLDDALSAISGGNAKVAGGHSLLPLMKLRLAAPGTLIDIGRLNELKGSASSTTRRIAIGAMTTYAELLLAAQHYGLLSDAVPRIGDIQVRNRGTVGGSIAHADPASDLPACWPWTPSSSPAPRAANGRSRSTASWKAFTDQPAARRGSSSRCAARPRDDAGSAYVSLENPASGYAIVGVAAVVFRGDGVASHRPTSRSPASLTWRIARARSSRRCRGATAHRPPSPRPPNTPPTG